jgi:predicted nucleic acid-binding protein
VKSSIEPRDLARHKHCYSLQQAQQWALGKNDAASHRDDALGHIKLATFKSRIGGVLALTEEDAALSADIRHGLQTNGQMIGAYDVLIAAQALARDALLVTHNSREFSRIAGLRWVDWMAE